MDATEPSSPDEHDAGHRPGRVAGYLAVWVTLVVAAAVVLVTVSRPSGSDKAKPSNRELTTTTTGSHDWQLRTFVTARESLYTGKVARVTGCRDTACTGGARSLGTFVHGFVSAVREQGSGLVSSGRYVQRYLNWDQQSGYYIDTRAHAFGSAARLVPFGSMFSTSPLLPVRTPFRVLGCGTGRGQDVDRSCDRLRGRQWKVYDLARPIVGRTIWVYIGLQPDEDYRTPHFDRAVLRVG